MYSARHHTGNGSNKVRGAGSYRLGHSHACLSHDSRQSLEKHPSFPILQKADVKAFKMPGL